MSIELKAQVCRVCGRRNDVPWYTAKEMMFGLRDEFRYFQCTQCECLQIAEFPSNISKYYPENYYSLAQNDAVKFAGLKGKIRRRSLSALVLNRNFFDRVLRNFYSPISLRVLKDLQVDRNTRILDVGSGSGHKFLYPLAELKFTNIAGCDPFIAHTISYSNGLKIYKTDVFGMEGKWDIITYHHVFEHVSNPLENLVRVHDLLETGGVCILRIPTVSSYAWEHYRTNWFQLDAPRHYFLHSIKSIEHLAAQAGLKLYRINFDSTYKQFAESEKYSRDEPLKQPRKKGIANFITRKLKKMHYQRLAREMNKKQMGDQAAFFLKKI
jgi:2-polyprenyl-3-methyl-5-hydroxy-6-metoxy-1,4-benzoquinol methylase